jgi:hypothetical protein
MPTKKAAKKAVKKAVKKPITIRLEYDYTLEDVQAAITPGLFRRLRAAHKHSPSTPILANVIPRGGPGIG